MRGVTPPSAGPRADGAPQVPSWFRRAVGFVLLAVAAFELSIWLFQGLRGFLGLVFLAWLFSISIEPLVDRLANQGMRRGLATGLVMLGIAIVITAFLGLFGAILVDQLSQFVTSLPGLVGDVVDWVNRVFGTHFQTADITDSLHLTPTRTQDLARELAPGLFGILSSLVGLLLDAFTVVLFAFYMSAEAPQLRRTVASWFPPRQQLVVSTVWEIAIEKTGSYMVAKFILAALSTFFTGIFLWVLGVPYWLPLAIWTGVVSQFIPTLGTYIAIAVPALVALAANPADGLWVLLFGVGYQQVENYLFSPRITARTMAVHPAVAFGAVLVGAALFGAWGALVSVPVVGAIQALIETYGHRYELVALEPVEDSARSEDPDNGP